MMTKVQHFPPPFPPSSLVLDCLEHWRGTGGTEGFPWSRWRDSRAQTAFSSSAASFHFWDFLRFLLGWVLPPWRQRALGRGGHPPGEPSRGLCSVGARSGAFWWGGRGSGGGRNQGFFLGWRTPLESLKKPLAPNEVWAEDMFLLCCLENCCNLWPEITISQLGLDYQFFSESPAQNGVIFSLL